MRLLATLFLAVLAFSAAPAVAEAKTPSVTLEGWFTGSSTATGRFTAINGVRRTFTVRLQGHWNGKVLTLREDFLFSDGTKDRKTWIFRKTGPGRYVGTREDVVGETEMTITGNVARFSYLVRLTGDPKEKPVRFHDRMEFRSDGTVLNTALVTKYGIPVARTVVEFSK